MGVAQNKSSEWQAGQRPEGVMVRIFGHFSLKIPERDVTQLGFQKVNFKIIIWGPQFSGQSIYVAFAIMNKEDTRRTEHRKS